MISRMLSSLGALALLASAALADANGNVVVVTDPNPMPFVLAAAEGDTLLFPPGNYGQVTIDGKSLHLVADVGGAVSVISLFVHSLSADQSVTLSGLNASIASTSIPLRLENNQGSVWVQDATFTSLIWSISGTPVVASMVNCADVVLTRCVLVGGSQPSEGASSGGHALSLTASNVVAFDCSFSGGPGLSNLFISSFETGEGGNALRMAGGSFFASGCTLTGGAGGAGAGTIPCSDGADGGDAAYLFAANPIARFKDCVMVGGIGGLAGAELCADGAPGLASNVLSGTQIDLPGIARTLTVPNPVREGETAQVQFLGQPGDLVFLIVAIGQESSFNPIWGQGVTADPFFLIPVGSAGPTGALNVPILINPFTNPARDSIMLREQGFFVSSSLELVLDGAQSVLHLDSSF